MRVLRAAGPGPKIEERGAKLAERNYRRFVREERWQLTSTLLHEGVGWAGYAAVGRRAAARTRDRGPE